MSEVYDPAADDGYEMSEDEYRAEVTRVLREYQGQQLRLHLIGPVISLIVHLIVIVLMSVMIVGSSKEPVEQFVVETVEMEVVELEEEILEELDEVVLEEVEVTEAPVVEVEEVVQPTEDVSEVADVGDMLDDAPLADDFGEVALDDMLTVMDSADTPLKLEGLYSARSGAGRADAVGRFGGSKVGQVAVDKALAWLAKVQKPDGSWKGAGNDVACTGMALLVFLAHGETPLSETYGTTVQNAMKWLSTAMMNTKPGGICGGRAYSHGIATYALSEAYGMTRIPFLRSAMDKGLERIIKGQQSTGGFDYHYKGAGQVAKWDLSVGGWQFQALKAGYAAGSTTPGLYPAIEKSISYLQNEAYANKKFGYSKPGTGGNMTGVGTVALQLMGARDSAQARGGVETIAAERLAKYRSILVGKADWKTSAGGSIYGWYYDTQAMFNVQGKEWREWQAVFEKVLVTNQNPEGYWEVEKGPGMSNTDDGGRILSTCWCVLQLEVYYRYLPTYDIKKMDKHNTATTLDSNDSGLIIQ